MFKAKVQTLGPKASEQYIAYIVWFKKFFMINILFDRKDFLFEWL